MIKTLEDLAKVGKSFCLSIGSDFYNSSPTHDACHVISGLSTSKEGEELLAGWELAVRGSNPKFELSDLEIEGFLWGLDFVKANPQLAELIKDAFNHNYDEMRFLANREGISNAINFVYY